MTERADKADRLDRADLDRLDDDGAERTDRSVRSPLEIEATLHRAFSRLQTFVIVVLATLVMVNIAVLVLLVPVARNNAENLRIVRSATDPTGAIYQRGQASTADAVRALINDNRLIHGQPTIPPPEEEPAK